MVWFMTNLKFSRHLFYKVNNTFFDLKGIFQLYTQNCIRLALNFLTMYFLISRVNFETLRISEAKIPYCFLIIEKERLGGSSRELPFVLKKGVQFF